MKQSKDVGSLLISAAGDPRRAAGKTLEYLVAQTHAKAGAVLSVDPERKLRVFSITEPLLDSFLAVRGLWTEYHKTLLGGRHVNDRGHVLAPIVDGTTLLGILCLESPRAFDPHCYVIFMAALAQVMTEAPRWRGPPFRDYLTSRSQEELQIEQLLAALTQHQWNIAATARALGVSRRTIYLQLQRYHIPRQRIPKTVRRRRPQEGNA